MTRDRDSERDEDAAPDRPCSVCRHAGHEHVLRETELEGNTVRQTYCTSCADWHDFVPDASDV